MDRFLPGLPRGAIPVVSAKDRLSGFGDSPDLASSSGGQALTLIPCETIGRGMSSAQVYSVICRSRVACGIAALGQEGKSRRRLLEIGRHSTPALPSRDDQPRTRSRAAWNLHNRLRLTSETTILRGQMSAQVRSREFGESELDSIRRYLESVDWITGIEEDLRAIVVRRWPHLVAKLPKDTTRPIGRRAV
jgi:hypothetical protein